MQRWEYTVEPFSSDKYSDEITKQLDEFGADGWEAVAMLPCRADEGGFRVMFKRELMPAVDEGYPELKPALRELAVRASMSAKNAHVMLDEVKYGIASNSPIAALKSVRKWTGAGLQEAKDAVDQYWHSWANA